MSKETFSKMESEWFDKKPNNLRLPESENLEMDALARERDIIESKNALFTILNDYSNEIPEKLMSGMEAIRMGKQYSKYRPVVFQATYHEFDTLEQLGVLSGNFSQEYDDLVNRYEARRLQGVKIRTTKEEIDGLDRLIKMALKELEEKGY